MSRPPIRSWSCADGCRPFTIEGLVAVADLIGQLRSLSPSDGPSSGLRRECQRDYAGRTFDQLPWAGMRSEILISPRFLEILKTIRRVAATASLYRGKTVITAMLVGRRYAGPGTRGRPECDVAAGGAVPEPAPRAGDRPGVPGRGVLRRPGRGAGQGRDGAPRHDGRRAGHRGVGYSRSAYYQAAAALAECGLDGLVRPSPDPAAVTSSPARSSAGPRSSWRPIPALGQPAWPILSPPRQAAAGRGSGRHPDPGRKPP